MGEIVLTLTRTWNVDHEVSVSCYTRAGTATDDIDFEQLDHDSTVTFAPNQTSAECVVNIYDDVVYEGKERFYVLVAAAADSLVITALSETPLCIYIIYDPNDGTPQEYPRVLYKKFLHGVGSVCIIQYTDGWVCVSEARIRVVCGWMKTQATALPRRVGRVGSGSTILIQ